MKEDVVSAAASAIQSNQAQALVDGLGAVYDQAQADKENTQGFTQTDIDAAVTEAKAVDQKSFDEAKATADEKFAELQAKLDNLAEKEKIEGQALDHMQAAITAVQDSVTAAFALFPAPPKTEDTNS